VLKKTHSKTKAHDKITLYRVLFFWHTAKIYFAVCSFVTHGKTRLCRVFYFGTWQSNKKKLSSHLETFSTFHIQHVVLYVKI